MGRGREGERGRGGGGGEGEFVWGELEVFVNCKS